MNQKVKYGTEEIEFDLKFSNRKTLGIKVFPDRSILVESPNGIDLEKIKSKVLTKALWIQKQGYFFLRFEPRTPRREYVSGETHLYLGKQYRLKVYPSKDNKVKLKHGYLELYSRDPFDRKKLENQLKSWYKNRARKHFNELFDKVLYSKRKFKNKEPKLRLRWMNNRWGSCSKNANITLNIELIKAKKMYIEYVIVHELCHLEHFNHTKDFYELLEKEFPNWKRYKQDLEEMMV